MQFISSVYLVQNVQIEFLYTNTRPAASEGISSFICETRSEAKHFIKCIWGGIHNSFLTSPVMKKKKIILFSLGCKKKWRSQLNIKNELCYKNKTTPYKKEKDIQPLLDQILVI